MQSPDSLPLTMSTLSDCFRAVVDAVLYQRVALTIRRGRHGADLLAVEWRGRSGEEYALGRRAARSVFGVDLPVTRWQSGVNLVACALIRGLATRRPYAGVHGAGRFGGPDFVEVFRGFEGSAATALTEALYRRRAWMESFLFLHVEGSWVDLRSLFRIHNGARRGKSPVRVSLNRRLFAPGALEVFLATGHHSRVKVNGAAELHTLAIELARPWSNGASAETCPRQSEQ